MRAWPAVLALICGWLTMASAAAATKEYALAPVPDWVQRVAPAETAEPPTGQISQGVHYLLIDTQTRVDAHDKVHLSLIHI